MPTIRTDIAPRHLDQARKAAEARSHSSAQPLIFSDLMERGLTLRVQDSSISWVLRYGKSTVSLGRLTEIKTVKAARELAAAVRAVIRNGEDPKAYLRARATGRQHDQAIAALGQTAARAQGKWTWEVLVARYVDEYLAQPKETRRGVKAPSQKTVAHARYYLTLEQWRPLHGKLLTEISAEDIEAVRDDAYVRVGPTASTKVVDYGRAALSWAKRKYKGQSGLQGVPLWWLEVEQRHFAQPRTRFLSLPQIARVLYVAETTRVMPGRTIKKRTSDTVLCALWWIVLTAQRSGASMALQRRHVIDDEMAPGWKIALFPAEDMKSRRYHALPIPPRVSMLIQRCTENSRDSDWVFPSYRQRSDPTGAPRDVHLFDTAVSLLIRRLRGRDPAGAKAGGYDLLEGIPPFSPHDLRRSLATILSDMKVRGDAASAVLDHSSGTPDGRTFAEAAVTRLAYNQSQRLELKREAMETWCNAIFAACDEEWDSHRPKRRLRIPQVPGTVSADRSPWYRRMERDASEREASLALARRRSLASLPPLSTLGRDPRNEEEDEEFQELARFLESSS